MQRLSRSFVYLPEIYRETPHGNRPVESSFSSHSSINKVQLDAYYPRLAANWKVAPMHRLQFPAVKTVEPQQESVTEVGIT